MSCICTKGDPCDYHAAACVVCPNGCVGHPEPTAQEADTRLLLLLMPQQKQRQDSLAAQLQDLIHVAHRLGMYDAADIITRTLVERIP